MITFFGNGNWERRNRVCFPPSEAVTVHLLPSLFHPFGSLNSLKIWY